MTNPHKVPKALQARYDEIVVLTDRICMELSLEEYPDMARQMAAALARKRPSPLATGMLPIWACGILYALGRINFLFDSSQSPHLTPDALCAPSQVKLRTAVAKATIILDLLQVSIMDPTWTLPSRLEQNPMVWMVPLTNGLIIDIRHAPPDLQEEAYRHGMIPYIPADRI